MAVAVTERSQVLLSVRRSRLLKVLDLDLFLVRSMALFAVIVSSKMFFCGTKPNARLASGAKHLFSDWLVPHSADFQG